MNFDGVTEGLSPAPLSHYTARDGTRLDYRDYDVDDPTAPQAAATGTTAKTLAIILHGSGSDSRYLGPLARKLVEQGAAHVVTPDIRGHGRDPKRRGDVDAVAQPQRDIVDLIEHVRQRQRVERVVLIGHSSGGGLAVRTGGGRFAEAIDDYVLLAPYLGHDAPTTRQKAGGWAQANVGRIVLIGLLEKLGVHAASGAKVVRFNLPQSMRDEYATPAYSYRMQQAMAPRDWQRDLAAISGRVLLLAGANDESMRVGQYRESVAPLIDGEVDVLGNIAHLDIVRAELTAIRVAQFVQPPEAPVSAGK
ncbi:alpha/beta hydrolase [Halomonas garicola]|uniref:alpha/beta hydrolase n=1 Tax=Halomonas garicola TaxID=1690008 RepID=UPI0028A21596|nr:alpha/beta fold hydrolase [Halomonas garicola]